MKDQNLFLIFCISQLRTSQSHLYYRDPERLKNMEKFWSLKIEHDIPRVLSGSVKEQKVHDKHRLPLGA